MSDQDKTSQFSPRGLRNINASNVNKNKDNPVSDNSSVPQMDTETVTQEKYFKIISQKKKGNSISLFYSFFHLFMSCLFYFFHFRIQRC